MTKEGFGGRAVRMWFRRARLLALAFAGAAIALALAGRTSAPVGPFDATFSVRPSWGGETTVLLAPLGRIRLDTHDAPVGLVLRVDELRLEEAERYAQDPSLLADVGDDLSADVRGALRGLLLRCLLAGALGGLAGALLARVGWRSGVAGAALGGVLVAGTGVAAGLTYAEESIAEPQYTGLLSIAPTAVGDARSIVENFGRYRVQLAELVGNVATLYQAAQGLPDLDPGEETVRVLHVSDVHLNPQAFDVMRQLAEQFELHAVLDTGDITDWGSEPEEALLGEIPTLDVPYVWVRGNHDSMATQAAVAAQPNAIVLDGGAAVEVAGLRLWGIGDPRYTPDKDQPTGGAVEKEAAEAFAPEVDEQVEAASEPVDLDVVLVHDARAAADLDGDVPLVLSGHTHRAREGRIGRTTRLLVEGSTGGGGLRGLQGEEPTPLACSVLYFDPSSGELVAYDRITVRGLGEAGVTIERHIARPLTGTTTTTTIGTTTTSTTPTTAAP
ncbi:MAG TPA: metallophosphoesterase [Acidimicrobiales bacterium]|nr:metallophosphoesterase [Acidimicrobiales bacterium]